MLKKLNFEATFSHTGKTIKGNHDFQKGLTAITGANETGKSMRIEMFRYAWFGAKALRSQLSSYTSISVQSKIEVNGTIYDISRSGNSVKLMKNGKPLAAGTKAVNEAVIRIFGYDMEVFDVSNACLQGEIEALTQKTPAERKRMVDRTIGLDSIDELVKEYTATISASKKAKETLEAGLGPEPQPPAQPSVTTTLAELEAQDVDLQAKINEQHQLETELQLTQAKEPDLFVPTIKESVEELYERHHQREMLLNRIGSIQIELSQHQQIDVDKLTQEKAVLDRYLAEDMPEKWYEDAEWRKERDRRSKVTSLTIDDLNSIAMAHDHAPIFGKIQKLENGETVTCPHCTKDFSLNHEEIERVKAQITWPADFPVDKWVFKGVDNGITSRAQAELAIQAKNDLAEFLAKPRPEEPSMNYEGSRTEVKNRVAVIDFKLAQVARVQELEQEKAEIANKLVEMPDVKDTITKKNEENQNQAAYDNAVKAWQHFQTVLARVSPRLVELRDVQTDLVKVREALNEVRVYEMHRREYEVRYEHHKKVKAEIVELDKAATLATNIRKGLNELKPKVKSYLIPSLSRVASNFLSEMTNSQRNTIDIDDNFEIMVDGQPVETLSGSGKAVANLAVRLGLGTVLTNKVFSVLFVDEVDASMDEERAKYTAQCLRNLTKVFSQIVLVSHQKPEADHYIVL